MTNHNAPLELFDDALMIFMKAANTSEECIVRAKRGLWYSSDDFVWRFSYTDSPLNRDQSEYDVLTRELNTKTGVCSNPKMDRRVHITLVDEHFIPISKALRAALSDLDPKPGYVFDLWNAFLVPVIRPAVPYGDGTSMFWSFAVDLIAYPGSRPARQTFLYCDVYMRGSGEVAWDTFWECDD